MNVEQDKGEFLYHTSCDSCHSSDGRAVYSNGSSFCFSCSTWSTEDDTRDTNSTSGRKTSTMSRDNLLHGEYQALKVRHIPEHICKQYNYSKGTDKNGNTCQIATYYDKNKNPVAQKLRYRDKTFKFIGAPKEATLFGMQLWGEGGKKLTITEGELDALSVATAFDGKYPVVSIPNGAQSARKVIGQFIDYISSFEEIYLWFDNDKHGNEALDDVIPMLPSGKVKVIRHSEYKDASDVLVNEGKSKVVQTFYNAETHRPDGVLTPEDLMEEVSKPLTVGLPWVFNSLTEATYGRRMGEIYAVGAGVGIGKTDFLTQQITYDIMDLNKKVGLFFLEQAPSETLRRVAGKVDKTAYHIPNGQWSQEELMETVKKLVTSQNLFLYNSFGSTEWGVIEQRIRFMVHSMGVEIVYLDHLTALASQASDERRYIDGLMESIASLAQELGIIITFVSHLTTPSSGSHEEGARVEAKHFRGSRAIMQWSYIMLGLERNNQHPDIEERKKTIIRILKERYTGQGVGKTVSLRYNTDTYMLEETDEEFEDVSMKDEDEDY